MAINRDDYAPCDCARAWREDNVEECGGCEEYRAARDAADDLIESHDEQATKAGDVDGLVAATLNQDDCDPRGRFIRRPELPEETWPAYRVAFETAFARELELDKRIRAVGRR